MPAYQDIPLATDKLSVSQDDIKNNFLAIKALVDVNHNTFAAGASPEGKHKKIDFTDLGADPAVVGADVAMYNNGSELFIKKAAGAAIPLTGAATLADTGTITLPSGLIIKWGRGTTVGVSAEATITYATAFPNNVFTVFATLSEVAGGATTAQNRCIRVKNYDDAPLALTRFIVRTFLSSSGAFSVASFNWLALGN